MDVPYALARAATPSGGRADFPIWNTLNQDETSGPQLPVMNAAPAVALILLPRSVEVTMPDCERRAPHENVTALVLADSVSEADALADGLRGSYGIEVLAVGSPGAARMALIGGGYDLLLAPGGAEVDWVAEIAPQVTVVLLGYAATAPSVPSLLIIPDWPQPLDSLVRAINWHLETWSGPQQAVPAN